MKFVWCILVLYPLVSSAAEKGEVEVRRLEFVDREFEASSNLSEQAQAGAKAMLALESTKCDYIKPGYVGGSIRYNTDHVGVPEIMHLPTKPCPGQSPPQSAFVPYCWGKVSCETPQTRILVRDVYCKASDEKTCPDAKKCALLTNLNRTMPSLGFDNDVGRRHGKQSAFLDNHQGGWGPSEKQRYIWNGDDENIFQKMWHKVFPPKEDEVPEMMDPVDERKVFKRKVFK